LAFCYWTTHMLFDSTERINKPEVEKLESIDPELAKQEIRAKDDMDAYDKFRVKGGAAQHRDPFAQKESGPTNIYKTQSKTAGSNWNDTKI
jgi:hypothetical protein